MANTTGPSGPSRRPGRANARPGAFACGPDGRRTLEDAPDVRFVDGDQAGRGQVPEPKAGNPIFGVLAGCWESFKVWFTGSNRDDEVVMPNGSNPVSRRNLVVMIFGAAFVAAAGKTAYLQTVRSGEIYGEGYDERTFRGPITHRRGTIYDRNGVVLAQSVDAISVEATPNRLRVYYRDEKDFLLYRDLTSFEFDDLIAECVATLGRDEDYYRSEAKLGGENLTWCYLDLTADAESASALQAYVSEKQIDGIQFVSTYKRVYPFGNLAGNVIGYIDPWGESRMGLEKEYDCWLKGEDGYLIEERSRSGLPIVGGEFYHKDAVDGENVIISIDIDIQRAAQNFLAEAIAKWDSGNGCVVVMQPKTGEILACASTPYLDISDLDSSDIAGGATNMRCIIDCYEPGSTIKPITVGIACDLGLADPDTVYHVPAQIKVGDDMVGDSDQRDYDMDMTLTNIMERSSNVGAVMVAESVGVGQFERYFDQFEIGKRTGVDYGTTFTTTNSAGEEVTYSIEEKGIIGDFVAGSSWTSMAFGQGMAVPPIQMARAISAIADEGRLRTPHFLRRHGDVDAQYPEPKRVISVKAADQVTQMMYSVMENGYGQAGRVPGYRLAGKTGTSERVGTDSNGYLSGIVSASFIGFGPIEDPQVMVYVFMDYVRDGSGSHTAADPWASIMAAALEKLNVAPSS